ncbi:MAG TPA: rhodanese-like domain-containing protein [Candidatus Limnocylindrales bacterium]|nr:rhodanese-like domain-containing protein [Candidatus Limnocylindrales bacterium]
MTRLLEVDLGFARGLTNRGTFTEVMAAAGALEDEEVAVHSVPANLAAAFVYWCAKLHRRPGIRVFGMDTPERTTNGIRAFKADLKDGATLLDVRSPEEFEAGHIPGAINIPWDQPEGGLDSDLRALASLYGPLGEDIIVYCQSGIRAAHTWFALHERLGVPRVRNYDGSWSDYSSGYGSRYGPRGAAHLTLNS